MAVNTVADFLAVLDKSKLLGDEQLVEVRRLAQQMPDATALAKAIARQGTLSRWQAAQLLGGRTAFFLGKYRLIGLLGRGGMGSVFLAEHTTMNRRVALKVVPRHVSKDRASLDRFFAEARAIAALDHANIVQAYSVDMECDRYFMVMEYIDGLDMQRIVEAAGPLDFARIADYIRQAAEGLAHAHARKMVHCDIKPSNLLVNQQGVVKILDMGLARLKDDDEQPAGRPEQQALGTVDYLAPEQALETADFDHRADIYSLGCTLYYLLTGHPPFPEGTLAQRIVKHQTQEPQSLLEQRPDTPPELVELCRKMMAKSPVERYQSAEEISRALAGWQAPAQTPAALRVKTSQSEEDLPRPAALNDSWWDEIVSTPPVAAAGTGKKNSSSEVHEARGAHKSDLRKSNRGKPAAWAARNSGEAAQPSTWTQWLSARRRIVAFVAAASAGVLLVAAVIVTLFIAFGRGEAPVAAHSATVETARPEPFIEPARVDLTASQNNNFETPAVKTVGEKPPGEKQPDGPKPNKTEGEQPRGEKSKTEPAKVDPPKPEPEKPEAKAESKPEVKPEAKPDPPPKAESKPDPPPAPKDPLAGLGKAADLPDVGNGASGEAAPLGTVHLGADDALDVQLVGSETAGRGGPAFSLRAEEGRKDHWSVRAEVETKNGKSQGDVARLSLDNETLNFQWLPPAAKVRAECLRNCGLIVKVGDKERFLPLRAPKELEPLIVDVDQGMPRKGKNECMFSDNCLPETSALRLHLDLDAPFPRHELKAVDARLKTANPLPPKGKVDILFQEAKLAPFALRVAFEVKQREVTVSVTPMYKTGAVAAAAGKRAAAKHRDTYAMFKPGEAAQLKAKLEGGQQMLKAGIEQIKDAKQKKAREEQLFVVEERLGQINALYDALEKTAAIRFRVCVAVDGERQIDLFLTPSAEQKVAETKKKGGK